MYTQSLVQLTGTVLEMVPCIFKHMKGGRAGFGDVAWGFALPLIAAHSAALTGDSGPDGASQRRAPQRQAPRPTHRTRQAEATPARAQTLSIDTIDKPRKQEW